MFMLIQRKEGWLVGLVKGGGMKSKYYECMINSYKFIVHIYSCFLRVWLMLCSCLFN